jgi:dolichol-phosphate mannosyltransferase
MPFNAAAERLAEDGNGLVSWEEGGNSMSQQRLTVDRSSWKEQFERYRSQQRDSIVFVVLPAYNEEAGIARLIMSLDRAMTEAGFRYQLLIVDDGSTDGTPKIVADAMSHFPVHVLNHRVNQGLGNTIRDGLLQAATEAGENDIVITMDADETHTPGLILAMVRQIREGCDVVIASRFQRGSRVIGLSLGRMLLSYGGSLALRALFPTRGVRDFTCGFRAYRAAVLHAAVSRYGSTFVNEEGFQCMVDILLKLRKLPLIFGEVPLILRYDQKASLSKMNVGGTILSTLRLMVVRRMGR